MLEILLDNKKGSVWDLSEIVSSVSWKTSRIGKASTLDLTMIGGGIYQDQSFVFKNGDILRIRKDNVNMFYGYVFDKGSGKDEEVKVKAYDQLRYLMADDTYVFAKATATQVIKRIASDFGLRIGSLEDTAYKIPAMVEDGKKLLDIICKALDLTLINSGKNYVFFDDFGKLALKNIESMKVDFVIGDQSLLYDYDYKESIDDDTYNRVKLVQDNKTTKKRDVYIAQDSANISNWGRLQHYQKVDENMNAAQVNDLLNQLLALKNRERKSLRLQAIGDARVRAGCYVPVIIEKIGVNQYFLVEECQHQFEGDDHTMTIDLKVI